MKKAKQKYFALRCIAKKYQIAFEVMQPITVQPFQVEAKMGSKALFVLNSL